MNREIEIPEGYEARIEGNKVILESKESEDEKIRNKLVQFLTDIKNISESGRTSWAVRREDAEMCAGFLAYLEKQKEQEPTPNWMPKFLDELRSKKNHFGWDEHRDFEGHIHAIINWIAPDYFDKKEQKPAPISCCHENGTEWSEEDNIGWDEAFACVTRAEKAAKSEEELQNAVTAERWLKEIKFMYCVHPVKQEWSEEDEKMNEEIRQYLKQDRAEFPGRSARLNRMIGWLISLRPQLKYEWSEEDEVNLGDIKCALYNYYGEERAEELYNILKSLRPQPKPTEDELNKKYWEGYKDAMEQYNKNVSFHQDYPTSPSIPRSCYEGGPCTNPHYDCVNCPRQVGGGTYIATPNTVTSDDSNNLEAHWRPSEEQMKYLYEASERNDYCGAVLKSLYNELKKLM